MAGVGHAAGQLPGCVDVIPCIAEENPSHASPPKRGLCAPKSVNLQAQAR
jgi:hypothetical protein